MSDGGELSKASAPELGAIFCHCQADFDFCFFQAVLERNPSHVDALRRQAELCASRGQYDQALVLDGRLVALLPHCCTAHYNLACSLAVNGHMTKAMQVLTQAIELGYCDFPHLEDDVDLDGLRELPEFVQLLNDIQRRP